MKSVGRIAIKALIYFEVVTLDRTGDRHAGRQPMAGRNGNAYRPPLCSTAIWSQPITSVRSNKPVGAVEFLLNVIPSSAVDGFAKGDILEVLFFSVLFAVGLAAAGDAGKPVLGLIEGTTKALFWIVGFRDALRADCVLWRDGFSPSVSSGSARSHRSDGFIAEFYATCALFHPAGAVAGVALGGNSACPG